MINIERRQEVGIFLYSFGALVYEIALVMLMPLLMGVWVLSNTGSIIAVACFFCGSGAGAILAWRWGDGHIRAAVSFQILWVLLLPFAVALILSLQGYWRLWLAPPLVSVPFVCVGFVVTHVLGKSLTEGRLTKLYCWNLLGAFLGTVACGYVLLPSLGLEVTLLLSLVAVVAGAVLLGTSHCPRPLVVLVCMMLAANMAVHGVDYDLASRSGDRALFRGWSPIQLISIQQEGDSYEFMSAGLSVSHISRPNNDTLTYEGMILFKGLRPQNVLVIGPGGGFYDVYQAYLARSQAPGVAATITAVEVDPLMVSTLKGEFSHLNDGLYNAPGVEVIVDDAQTFLARGGGAYDLVMFNEVREMPTHPHMLADERLYTLESLERTADVLSSKGTIAILVSSSLDERAQNVLATFLSLARSRFSDDPWRHVGLVDLGREQWVNKIMDQYIVLYSPKPANLRALSAVSMSQQEMERFTSGRSPITMDRPFPNFRLSELPPELDLLFRALASALGLALIFLGVAGSSLRLRVSDRQRTLTLLVIFVVMGAWSMTCQGLYISKASEVVGASLYGRTTVIATFLLFGGIASLLVPRVLDHLPLMIALLPAYNALLAHVLLPGIDPAGPLQAKLIALAASLFPLAMLNGMVFPGLLMLARRLEPSVDVPWGYSADVAGAVIGVFLAMVLPLHYGYGASILFFPIVVLLPSALLYRLIVAPVAP